MVGTSHAVGILLNTKSWCLDCTNGFKFTALLGCSLFFVCLQDGACVGALVGSVPQRVVGCGQKQL